MHFNCVYLLGTEAKLHYANYTNILLQSTLRREGDAGLTGASSMRLIVKGLGVLFTHREGISTPCVHPKGRQPLIKCANMTSKCFIFPFYVFLCFYVFLYFLSFVVDKGISLTPTYPQLR